MFFSVCVSADGFEELRQLGLLRYNAGMDIEIYDYYLSEVDITGSRMQAQTNCARGIKMCGISEYHTGTTCHSTIYGSIVFAIGRTVIV